MADLDNVIFFDSGTRSKNIGYVSCDIADKQIGAYLTDQGRVYEVTLRDTGEKCVTYLQRLALDFMDFARGLTELVGPDARVLTTRQLGEDFVPLKTPQYALDTRLRSMSPHHIMVQAPGDCTLDAVHLQEVRNIGTIDITTQSWGRAIEIAEVLGVTSLADSLEAIVAQMPSAGE